MNYHKRPLLAAEVKEEELGQLTYPVMCSYKIDGVRARVTHEILMSRKLLPIPNRQCQLRFGKFNLNGLEGELVVGEPTQEKLFRKTTSAVMSEDGDPDITFYVFDSCLDRIVNSYQCGDFEARLKYATDQVNFLNDPKVKIIEQVWLYSPESVLEYYRKALDLGYEGIILKSPTGRYKNGRSTLKEGLFLKLTPFITEEVMVVGFLEKMKNENKKEINALGYTKRSSSKANKVGADTLGALICQINGKKFKVGTGWDKKGAKEIWDNREKYLFQLATIRHKKTGNYDKPRNASFKGFRNSIDISQ